jgi:hypothetical protein
VLAKTEQAEAKQRLAELNRQPRVHDVGDICAEIRRGDEEDREVNG